MPSGTGGAISLEGTVANGWQWPDDPGDAGSGSAALDPTAVVVMLIGLIATLAESLISALAQDRVRWLSNEW